MHRGQPLGISSIHFGLSPWLTMPLIAVFIYIDIADPCRTRHFWIWVADPSEISRSSLNVQVLKKVIILRQGTELRNSALRVLDITEDDCFGGACLLACRFYTICRKAQIAFYPCFYALRDLCSFDPLQAVGAFLHDTSHPNRNVRIFLHLRQVIHTPRGQRPEIQLLFALKSRQTLFDAIDHRSVIV